MALDNVNIKIDDTTVSVMDFTSGLNWQENPDPETDVAERPADCSAESGGSGAEEVVEPKIENPQPEEKPLGETLKISFLARYCRK